MKKSRKKQNAAWSTNDNEVALLRKLVRIFKFLDLMAIGRSSLREISHEVEISERTIYRYIHALEECGFGVEVGFNGRVFIAPGHYPEFIKLFVKNIRDNSEVESLT